MWIYELELELEQPQQQQFYNNHKLMEVQHNILFFK